jgi:hypothetical protein
LRLGSDYGNTSEEKWFHLPLSQSIDDYLGTFSPFAQEWSSGEAQIGRQEPQLDRLNLMASAQSWVVVAQCNRVVRMS